MKPFENESDSISLAGMAIENRIDRVSVYGSMDLTRDKEGLELALALKEVIDSVVSRLSSEELPDRIEIDPTTTVPNPF